MKTVAIKINRSCLSLIECHSFSFNDFSYLDDNGGYSGEFAYRVCIGSWRIANIIRAKNGKYLISNIYSTFKSFSSAIRGLLNRLNKNE